MTEAQASLKRTLIGKVVSDKRAKTVTVLVERRVKHPSSTARSLRSSKYHAHDEKGQYKLGDVIEITESRPLSKTKNWVATRLVQKARSAPRADGSPLQPGATSAIGQKQLTMRGLFSLVLRRVSPRHPHIQGSA
jgi:small subunit ribosomal protein S17